MFKKSKRATTTFCISILILVILNIVVAINFFTKDRINKQSIAGINPVSTTKSIMIYEEPLTVILEEQEKKKVEQQEEIIENSQHLEVDKQSQEIKERMQEDNDQKIEKKDILEKYTVGDIEQEQLILKTITEGNVKEETVIEQKKQPEEISETILTEYKSFPTVGRLEIPKTGLDIPILNQVTVEGMKNAPCLLYSTGKLNENGNNLIVGHNFRNGTIFSNNKNLKLGDKIYVTTLDGNRVEYTIYDKFITTAEDVSYIKRDTNNKPEITLSCCTDDDEERIIILARI